MEDGADSQDVGVVRAISRYPVKSLQGEALDAGEIRAGGLAGDRSWGVIDTASGKVLTGKRVGELLEGAASLTGDGPRIVLPDGSVLDGPGAATDAALSAWLGTDVSLRPAPADATPYEMSFNVDDQEVDKFDWATPEGSYLDLSPIHVLTTAALAAAATAYPDGDWSVHRFRPTLLIESDGAGDGFVENDWVGCHLAVGDAVLDIAMPTIRCSMPTKAQPAHGLQRDLQIFKSLAASNQQNLGAYANVITPGTVRVGDAVRLLSA